MIYTSQHATGAQPGINPIESHPLEQQPSLQSQINTDFAEISSQIDPIAAPERLGNLNSDTIYAVGYEAVGHIVDQSGVKDVTVAVGAARLPERFYASGQAPEKSLEEVAATQLQAAQARVERVHPGAVWQHMQEQQRMYDALRSGNDDDQEGEDAKHGKRPNKPPKTPPSKRKPRQLVGV